MSEITIGEQRVRTQFNPSNDTVVDQIKQKTAQLINLCEEQKMLLHELHLLCARNLSKKDERLAYKAIGTYQIVSNSAEANEMVLEEAAMWAVKAATA